MHNILIILFNNFYTFTIIVLLLCGRINGEEHEEDNIYLVNRIKTRAPFYHLKILLSSDFTIYCYLLTKRRRNGRWGIDGR